MSKEEAIAVMVETFIEINKSMALMSGMGEEEVSKFIEQSTPSIEHALTAVYEVMVEKDIIK
jgi:hypothetical protein